jgi:signal transduction histidine kinase
MAEAERQRVARFREMMILPGLERGLLAEVTHAKEPRGVSNAREELADLYRRLDWEPVPTAYLCPMVFEGECEGLIYVDKCFGKDTLTEWDKQVLQTAAVSLAGTAREHRLGQQLRDQILSLSHSAITPYATISGCAHELAETVTSETSRQLLTLIQSEARRGEDSIRRLLRYQQATRTGITPTLSDIDICGVVNERIEPYLAILRLCGIPCDIRVPDQAVMVTADPELLGLALGELANNAYLAVQNSALPRADRFVRVHVNSDGATNRCHVEIGNCGNRIDADRVDRLFQPFVSGTGSTGLGLWVAREMARRQGGEVRCDSASETPLFVLTIPLAGTVKTEKIA